MRFCIVLSALVFCVPALLPADELDDAIAALLAGIVDEIDPDKWNAIVESTGDRAIAKYREGITELYLTQIKWSVIDPDDHGGWPVRSLLVMNESTAKTLAKELEQKLSAKREPIVAYALLAVSLHHGEDDRNRLSAIVAEDAFLKRRLDESWDDFWVPFTDAVRESKEKADE
jgi:hypothetical protein